MIRQPIVSIMGHIDHGKTTLLDYIRTSTVAAKEAGGITQHIGATEVPISSVQKTCGTLLDSLKLDITLPGYLFIDTPGHAAFTHLRKRGGSICDIGVLIVDVNDCFMPQSYEALNILKTYKTPFVVVANKLDTVSGWQTSTEKPLLQNFMDQRYDVQQDIDTKLYQLVEVLHKNGYSSERFDRVKDFTTQIAVVPISAKTGEGIPEFLMVLTGLTQKYMQDKLEIDANSPGRGTILEVKQEEGLGTTLDIILYDGCIKKGDTIVAGTTEAPVETTVKALFRPNPMMEMRTGKQYTAVDSVAAAAGIKLSAPGLEGALAGAPVSVVSGNIEEVKAEIQKQIEQVQVKTDTIGAILKADTLGSLEALVKMFNEEGIKIRKAGFGDVSRKDVMEAEAVKKESNLNAVVFAFNVKVSDDAKQEADDNGIKILEGDIVYSMIDEYKQWKDTEQNKSKEEIAETTVMPGKIELLPQYIFRQSKPAICGIRVLAGVIKQKYDLMNSEGKVVGNIKEIKEDKESRKKATAGQEVAISIAGGVIGKNIKENDTLYVRVPGRDIQVLKTKLKDLLTADETALLDEIKKISK
jgi:translation initiation factor 5B|tara:strand:- start:61 stop:1806 length:1746 start_codon:yes stop_codon:yes gene_type:complete